MRLPQILIKDKMTGNKHILGTDIYDSWYIDDDGVFQYFNLQNGEGTGKDGDYEFLKNDDVFGYQKNQFMVELQEIKSESYQRLLEIMAGYRHSSNPISRETLEKKLSLSDRKIRDMIKQARKRGIPILSDSSNYGYFLSYHDADISRFLNREILSKIKDLSETFQALSVHIKPVDPNQITIDEVVKC